MAASGGFVIGGLLNMRLADKFGLGITMFVGVSPLPSLPQSPFSPLPSPLSPLPSPFSLPPLPSPHKANSIPYSSVGAVSQIIGYTIQATAPPFPLMALAATFNGFGWGVQMAQGTGYATSLDSSTKIGYANAAYGTSLPIPSFLFFLN